MSAITHLGRALPSPQPERPGARLVLFGVRQIGTGGLHDAATAHAFVTAFGKGFRRPLLLLRTLMAEMSTTAAGPIQIAPWCCPRMTVAEGALMRILETARPEPDRARLLLIDLLGSRKVEGVAATAHALADAFADMGLPFEA